MALCFGFVDEHRNQSDHNNRNSKVFIRICIAFFSQCSFVFARGRVITCASVKPVNSTERASLRWVLSLDYSWKSDRYCALGLRLEMPAGKLSFWYQVLTVPMSMLPHRPMLGTFVLRGSSAYTSAIIRDSDQDSQ